VIVSLLISTLLLCCYPLISLATGYKFIIPDNWLWLSLGVFALHGIAEETAFRGFLFHHLREHRSFIKAAWLSVLFFSFAHIPIILSQGILIGGTATLLAIVISFPFAFLFEKGKNTIWAPAIIHFAVDTIIPILAYDNTVQLNKQTAILYWFLLFLEKNLKTS
jgi:membrane protease YdiL (CAAX protease family)